MSDKVTWEELETAVSVFNNNPTMIRLRRSLMLFLLQNVKAFVICNRKFIALDRGGESFYEIPVRDEAGRRGTTMFFDEEICVSLHRSDHLSSGNLFLGHFNVGLEKGDERVLQFTMSELVEAHLFVGWPPVGTEVVG